MAFEKEKYICPNGDFVGRSFNRVWAGHRFTDEECRQLSAGETIVLTDAKKKNGDTFACEGHLEEQEYNGHPFLGFKMTGFPEIFPETYCGYTFTDSERNLLELGREVYVDGFISKAKGRSYGAYVKWDVDPETGKKRIMMRFDK